MAPKTIILKGDPRLEEYDADAAITPGHILQLNSDGEVLKHATEGGYWDGTVAGEDALQGREIDTDYAAADKVTTHCTKPGDKFYPFLQATENVAIGDFLISAGDGTLIDIDNATSAGVVKQVLAVVEEALDLSASGAAATRVPARRM